MVPLPPVLLFPSPPVDPPPPLPPSRPRPWRGSRPHLRRVTLPQGLVLYEPGEPIADVYLPAVAAGAVVSLLAVGAGDEAVEAGLVGAEGLVGLPAVLGATAAPHRAVSQLPGPAWRLPAAAYAAEARRDGPTWARLGRYTQALLVMVAQGALCNARHPVARRAARWLLLARDRAGTDDLALTHEFLGQMLAVRRASVTDALAPLQAAGLLRQIRGRVVLLDGAGLAAAACPCYALLRDEFAALAAFAPGGTPPPPPDPRRLQAALSGEAGDRPLARGVGVQGPRGPPLPPAGGRGPLAGRGRGEEALEHLERLAVAHPELHGPAAHAGRPAGHRPRRRAGAVHRARGLGRHPPSAPGPPLGRPRRPAARGRRGGWGAVSPIGGQYDGPGPGGHDGPFIRELGAPPPCVGSLAPARRRRAGRAGRDLRAAARRPALARLEAARDGGAAGPGSAPARRHQHRAPLGQAGEHRAQQRGPDQPPPPHDVGLVRVRRLLRRRRIQSGPGRRGGSGRSRPTARSLRVAARGPAVMELRRRGRPARSAAARRCGILLGMAEQPGAPVAANGRPPALAGAEPDAAGPVRGPARVLLVLDQPILAGVVELALGHVRGRFRARVAPDAAAAAGVLAEWRPHLAVVDMDLARGEMLARLGYTAPPSAARVPVVALTRRGDLKGKLEAFDQGVDDVLSVPFSPEELVARVLAVLRRTYHEGAALRPVLRLGELEIDILHRRVRAGTSELHLTALELSLLYLLAANAGRLLTRDEILDHLWGVDYAAESNVVDRHIRNLRAKLQNGWRRPRYIATVPGRGYRFLPTDAGAPRAPPAVRPRRPSPSGPHRA